ncbi:MULTISPECIES: helix-turn-helix domain-containing protein [unclassified Brenneria]|uniref:GlxA family transcriptional regulator n=1 Tax=unclassified Brenneria TaxID=2634434 RepID=UPI0029C2311D|nr:MULTISPECIES: helix-turn-helix domain-containing protein [unclassified Brenneria]MDX5629282.1 DJ-1/PfpI family protein [Brenneria sp. L3-3Z]MDX5696555.1 DJ-1/PfpI family protein [Brenneria sp. L4-2C]
MRKQVYFLTLPGVLALDLAGPAETLRLAGQFDLHHIGPENEVRCSTGLTLSRLAPLPDALPAGGILIIPGVTDSLHHFSLPQTIAARRWLERLKPALSAQTLTLVCVCAGALLAAQATLLDGYQCTTHHNLIARLAQSAPLAQVKDNRIFVEDRGIYTSAGITAGIDLALHLVGQLLDTRSALQIAREMVVYFRRTGSDAQLSPWLQYRNHLHPVIHRAQDIMSAEPEAAWPLSVIADKVHVSSRHLTRLFRAHLGISVREYHERLRVAVAQQRLRQGVGLEKSALLAGFSSARQLRRAQLRQRQQDE